MTCLNLLITGVVKLLETSNNILQNKSKNIAFFGSKKTISRKAVLLSVIDRFAFVQKSENQFKQFLVKSIFISELLTEGHKNNI